MNTEAEMIILSFESSMWIWQVVFVIVICLAALLWHSTKKSLNILFAIIIVFIVSPLIFHHATWNARIDNHGIVVNSPIFTNGVDKINWSDVKTIRTFDWSGKGGPSYDVHLWLHDGNFLNLPLSDLNRSDAVLPILDYVLEHSNIPADEAAQVREKVTMYNRIYRKSGYIKVSGLDQF